ncbi:MAG: PorT family protein [Saprospiraceae bacterium]|nr:PorT family protein [Saprospiraceae bacterium]
MKKLFFTLLVVCGFIYVSNAQLGVRAGLNFSSYSVKGGGVSLNSDSQVGFHFGLTNDFKLTDNITFRPGLLYSGKGGKLDFLGESISTKLSYLDIPLSFVYNFSGSDSGFFAEVGPYVSMLLAAKSGDEDVKDNTKSLDLGLNVGLGYDLGTFIVGANYGLGLANIAKNEDGDDSTTKYQYFCIWYLPILI